MFDLKRFRKDHKLSQIDVAFLFECNQSNIAHFEKSGRDLTKEQYQILEEKYGDITHYYTEHSESDSDENQSTTPKSISSKWEDLVYRQQDVIESLTKQLEELNNENKRLIDTINMLTSLMSDKKAV